MKTEEAAEEQAKSRFVLEPEVPIPSPKWHTGTKRIVFAVSLLATLLILHRIRALVVPLIMSAVVAYLVLPVVNLLQERTRLSRNSAIVVVYALIAGAFVAVPLVTLPPLIAQVNGLVDNAPEYLARLGTFLSQPVALGEWVIPLNDLPIERIFNDLGTNLVDIIGVIGRGGFSLFGNLATATLSTLGWVLVVVVFSYYIVKDHRLFWRSLVGLAPAEYHGDLNRMGGEISAIWQAFLRGQLVLGFVIFVVTFVLAIVVQLPSALLLALLAGLLEFIPNIGPVIASIPAVFLALSQSDGSWLGAMVGPIWYALVVLLIYGLVQRVENIYLVPGIIGRSLNLHPLVVLVGALAGASIAGIFGIMLAAPLLASGRLIFLYIYRKLLDQPPFTDTVPL